MTKKRLLSLLLCLCLMFGIMSTAALAETDTEEPEDTAPGELAETVPEEPEDDVFAELEATPNVLSIKITMTTPEVGKPLPTTAKTSSSASYKVTNVSWSGQLDGNGNMAYDTVYTAVFTVEMKDGKDTKFSTAAEKEFVKNASINGEYKGFTKAEKVSDTMVKLTYELAAVSKPTISKISISLDSPSVGYSPDAIASITNSSANKNQLKVTEAKWSGEVDNYGLAIAGAAYTFTFTVEIKDDYPEHTFTDKVTATVNSKSANVERVSDKKAIVTYTFPALSEVEPSGVPTVDKSKTYSQAEADANCPKLNPITIVVSEDNQDMDFINNELGTFMAGAAVYNFLSTNYHTLDGDVVNSKNSPWIGHSFYGQHFDYFRVDRIVYDLYRPDDYSVIKYLTAKELWLSPKCDIQGILNNIGRSSSLWSFFTYDYTIFIPDSVYPNGPSYRIPYPPGCRVMLYSGSDVYAAAEKGKDAAREWCFDHSYTAKIEQRDRVYRWDTCQNHRLYYYSCVKCGKCEYNPNHYWVYTDAAHENIGVTFTEFDGKYTAHQYEIYTVSDEHFLGLNAQGDRVYLRACEWCGTDQKQDDLATTYDYYKNGMNMDGGYSDYLNYMEKVKKSWSPGGTAYELRMRATPGKDYLDGYVVEADKFVTATTSGWATQSVQLASNAGLIDKALLGDNYTGSVSRLQFCSIAVKMAEKMTGKTIAPAPSGTFSDTDSEYVRKASAAGITSGVGEGKFDPNGTLDRQQMATFIYRALQYVKANSDIEYTVWWSKLANYSDAGQIASWAKDSMDFMNALGLIAGTSDTTLSPGNFCTIEQALMVAYRSLSAGDIGWYQYVDGEHDTPATYSAPGYGFINCGDRIWFTSADGDCVDTHGIECHVVVKNNNFYPIKDR